MTRRWSTLDSVSTTDGRDGTSRHVHLGDGHFAGLATIADDLEMLIEIKERLPPLMLADRWDEGTMTEFIPWREIAWLETGAADVFLTWKRSFGDPE